MAFQFKVIVVGLENAGKTCLLQQLKKTEQVNPFKLQQCFTKFATEQVYIYPTACFETHQLHIEFDKLPVLAYDMSGEGRHRENWKIFYQEVDGILFVIDSTDSSRFKTVKETLETVFKNSTAAQLPIVIAYNKSDDETMQTKESIDKFLNIEKLASQYNIKYFNIKQTNWKDQKSLKEALNYIKEKAKK